MKKVQVTIEVDVDDVEALDKAFNALLLRSIELNVDESKKVRDAADTLSLLSFQILKAVAKANKKAA